MSRGNFSTIQRAIDALHPLLQLIPTDSDTADADRTELTSAISAVHTALDQYPKRSRKRKDEDDEEANWLDQQGVAIWNLALRAGREIGDQAGQADLLLIAHVKYAGFKLINAATNTNVMGPYRIRLLSLASKAASSLLAAGDEIKAGSVCAAAADLEQMLVEDSSTYENDDPEELKVKLKALIQYYLVRCDMAMADSNESLAFQMAENATKVDTTGALESDTLKTIAAKFCDVGNALRKNPEQVADACMWLQIGLEIVDKAESKGPTIGLHELKVALLRASARAELSKDSLDHSAIDRATTILEKLSSLSNTLDYKSVQEIKVLQLHILQQQKAKEGDVRIALGNLMEGISWTDEAVSELLGEIGCLNGYKDLQAFARLRLLSAALEDPEGSSFVPRILLSILLAVRKLNQDHQTALRTVTQALEKIAASEVDMDDKTAVTACQTVIWSLGEASRQSQHHTQAAQWYILAAHSAFSSVGRENFSKCRRKAALSYIHAEDLANAQAQLDECPPEEATTQYLTFLVAANESREIAAVAAIESILQCPDLDGKQLLLIAQVANKKGLHNALQSSLTALLTAIKKPEVTHSVQIHGITLVKCLVELAVNELKKSDNKNKLLVDTLLHYFESAHQMIDELQKQGEGQEHIKSIAWLYKTAYNAGIQGAMSWTLETQAAIMDIASQMIGLYQAIVTLDCDPDLPLQKATAMFACMTSNFFMYREMEAGEDKTDLLENLVNYVDLVRGAISEIDTSRSKDKRDRLMRTLTITETELLCEQQDWQGLEVTLEPFLKSEGHTGKLLEAILSVLANYPRCPTHVTYRVVERLLETLVFNDPEDVAHFAHWTHSLLLILFHRATDEDENKAYYGVQRALGVLNSKGGQYFPSDVAEWLVSTVWSRGVEKFGRNDIGRGKKWCEMALDLCTVVPGARKQHKMMVEYYQKLLAKTMPNAHRRAYGREITMGEA